MNDMEATRDERPWALVSGASGGLGQAFSRHLASCGVNPVSYTHLTLPTILLV